MNKKLILIVVVIGAIISGLASCTGCTGKGDKAKDTIPTFAKGDTVEVLNMVEMYLEYVKNKEYDKAIEMLHDITNDSVAPLSAEMERKVRQEQQVFPVLDYKRDTMSFINEHRVEVTYDVEFFERDSTTNIPNTVKMTFAPQRINATWYLCLLDRSYMK